MSNQLQDFHKIMGMVNENIRKWQNPPAVGYYGGGGCEDNEEEIKVEKIMKEPSKLRDSETKNYGYKVIKEDDLDILIKKTDNLIEKGWAPQGGIAIYKLTYFQSMYKVKPSLFG